MTYELLSQDGSTFQTHRNHILPYYPKEPVIFPNLKQYHSTSSLIKIPDTDSYQDTFQFSPLYTQSIPDSSRTRSSTKYKTVSNIDPTPTSKYQNLTYSSFLQDNLHNTIDSTDSDFEMLPNRIYYSNSSNSFLLQTFPRIADSPNISLTPPHDSQTVLNYTRAPHSPNNLRSLPPKLLFLQT